MVVSPGERSVQVRVSAAHRKEFGALLFGALLVDELLFSTLFFRQ
jgi:molybdopterin synthase catalytic subunit